MLDTQANEETRPAVVDPAAERVGPKWIAAVALFAILGVGGGVILAVRSPSAAVAPQAAPTIDELADAAKARTLLISRGDLGRGWTSRVHKDAPETSSSAAASTDLDACLGPGVGEKSIRSTAEVEGPDLSRGTAFVWSVAGFFGTQAEADAVFSAMRAPRFAQCVKSFGAKALLEDLPAGVSASLSAKPLRIGRFGEATVALRITVLMRGGARRATAVVDMVVVGKGRSYVVLALADVGKPFDAVLQQAVLRKLDARLASA